MREQRARIAAERAKENIEKAMPEIEGALARAKAAVAQTIDRESVNERQTVSGEWRA